MVLGKNDKLVFGKYKGKTISEISDLNPGYIVWLDEKVNTISIDQKIVSDCRELCDNDIYPDYSVLDFGNKD